MTIRFRGRSTGFTMVELIIAIFILAFGIVTYLTVIGSSTRLQNISADVIKAHNAVRAEVETIRAFSAAAAFYEAEYPSANKLWKDEFPGNYYAYRADHEMGGSYHYITYFNVFGALNASLRAYYPNSPNRDGKAEIFLEPGDTIDDPLWRACVQVWWRPSKGRVSSVKLETTIAKM